MFSPLLAFSSYLHFIGPASALVSAPNCTYPILSWSFNSLQQSPCLVAAYLAAVCTNGVSSIPALQPGDSYTGPSGTDDDDQCKCNTVVYNLISACDACQGEPWFPYSMWSAKCTTNVTAGTFPEPVPDGTRVPLWAYIDTSADIWNFTVAQARGDSPEVTGTSLIVPTSTSQLSQSTITPSSSGGSSPASASQSDSNRDAGAIGGVVGGIVGAALITGVVVWFVVRRRRARSPPSDRNGQGGEMGQLVPVPDSLTIETPRLDVSDSLFHLPQQL